MSPVSQEQRYKAAMAAVAAVICVLIFSVVFAGMAHIIVSYTPRQTQQNIQISEQENAEPFYLLVIGSNSREGTMLYNANAKAYAETILLAHVNPTTYTVDLVTMPCDTELSPKGNTVDTALTKGKPEDVVSAVEKLTGVNIDYYMMTTLLEFSNLVDAFGGIDMDIPVTVAADNPMTGKKLTVKAGAGQHLNGAQALTVARVDSAYKSDGDACRQQLVRTMAVSLFDKMLRLETADDARRALLAFRDNVTTDMDFSTVGGLYMSFSQHVDEVVVRQGTGPYKLVKRDKMWAVPYDEETWGDIFELIDFDEDPTGVVTPPKVR